MRYSYPDCPYYDEDSCDERIKDNPEWMRILCKNCFYNRVVKA